MGAWGSGNLESDGAQDALADLCESLFLKVIQLLKHPRVHEYDDEPIDELFVNIEVIFALKDRGMISMSPPLDEVEPLLTNFLLKWDEYSGPWPERRAVIEDSFQKFRDIVSASSSDGLSHRLDLIADKFGEQEDGENVDAVYEEEKRRVEKRIEDILGDEQSHSGEA